MSADMAQRENKDMKSTFFQFSRIAVCIIVSDVYIYIYIISYKYVWMMRM